MKRRIACLLALAVMLSTALIPAGSLAALTPALNYQVYVQRYVNQRGDVVSNPNVNYGQPKLVEAGHYLSLQSLAPVGSVVTRAVIGYNVIQGNGMIYLPAYYPIYPNQAGDIYAMISELHFNDGTGGGTLYPDAINLRVGDSYVLTTDMFYPMVLYYPRYQVVSRNTGIVQVMDLGGYLSGNFTLRGIKAGTTEVYILDTVTMQTVAVKTVNVLAAAGSGSGTGGAVDEVDEDEDALRIGPSEYTIRRNVRYRCVCKLDGEGIAAASLKWKSSNTRVLTVDSRGYFRGRRAGTVTLTGQTKDGVATATMEITVE